MATKASRIALSASNLSSTGNITADLFDDIDSINFLRSDESDTMTGNLSVSGNVGIGTSSPAALLSVYNASNPYANFADAANYLNVGVITSNYGLINSSLPISFQISDTERMRIDSSGNVGIGTSSPSSATWSNFLQVEATYPGVVYNSTAGGSNYKFSTGVDDNVWIVRDETAGATRMLINSSGLVGIGTSSPTHALTVKSSGVLGKFEAVDQAAELRIESPTVDVIGLYTGTNDALTFGTASTERMRIDSSGVVRIGGQTGTLKLGNNGTYHADIEWEYNNNELAFTTNNVGNFTFNSNGTERMRIDSSGNVKIGPNAQDIQLLPASTNSGVNMVYLRGNAADEKSTITLNHYGVRSFDISAGVIGSGLFHIGNGVSDPAFVINGSSNVGIGTASPLVPLHILGASNETEALRVSSGASGTGCKITFRTPDNGDVSKYIMQNAYWTEIGVHSNEGLRIRNDSNAIKFSVSGSAGNCWISGSLSKGSGSFKIDHPLPEKNATHNLVHSFIESPQADNLYRGKVDLIGGLATVNIDIVARMTEGTFAALNREVQCFTTNESGWTAIKGSVIGNILTIVAQADDCTDTISWMVIGERKDAHMLSEETDWTDSDGKVIIEPLKVSEEDQLAKSIAYHTSAGI